MQYLEEAGMLRAVQEGGFQLKDGAVFVSGTQRSQFDFQDKFSPGWSTTYQVQRARFDHSLAVQAQAEGAEFATSMKFWQWMWRARDRGVTAGTRRVRFIASRLASCSMPAVLAGCGTRVNFKK